MRTKTDHNARHTNQAPKQIRSQMESQKLYVATLRPNSIAPVSSFELQNGNQNDDLEEEDEEILHHDKRCASANFPKIPINFRDR